MSSILNRTLIKPYKRGQTRINERELTNTTSSDSKCNRIGSPASVSHALASTTYS